MNYWYDEDSDLWGWSWTLNCGYQCWDSKYTYADPAECQRNLESFLKTWTGPTK